ncbi:RIP metalloprotease RseP [Candidatus Omnitrophota bacterium]
MISILAFLFVFGILVFIHEFGHFILAKKNGVQIEKFSFGFGRKLWSKKIGQTEYLISAIPLGGYIKMAGDEPNQELKGAPGEFLSKSCGQRAQIVAAGPVLNYLLAFLLFSFIFIIGAPTLTTKVGEVVDDYPAQAAGLKSADQILSIDGKEVKYWDDLAEIIHQKTENQRVILEVQRQDQVLTLGVIPRVEEHPDLFGQKTSVGLIGISPSEEITTLKYNVAESFYEGGKKLIQLTGLTLKSLWLVITRRLSFKESFAGPIMIFQLTGSAARMGFVSLLYLMAVLSMSLAIFNFLPVPVLDGGHLLFISLEKLRKRPVQPKTQELATQAGILVLVSLMLLISYYDVMRSGWLDKVGEFWNSFGQGQ